MYNINLIIIIINLFAIYLIFNMIFIYCSEFQSRISPIYFKVLYSEHFFSCKKIVYNLMDF